MIEQIILKIKQAIDAQQTDQTKMMVIETIGNFIQKQANLIQIRQEEFVEVIEEESEEKEDDSVSE